MPSNSPSEHTVSHLLLAVWEMMRFTFLFFIGRLVCAGMFAGVQIHGPDATDWVWYEHVGLAVHAEHRAFCLGFHMRSCSLTANSRRSIWKSLKRRMTKPRANTDK
jgi:hypothetical protein